MQKYIFYTLILISLVNFSNTALAVTEESPIKPAPRVGNTPSETPTCTPPKVFNKEGFCMEPSGIYNLLAPIPCERGQEGCVCTSDDKCELKTFDPTKSDSFGRYLNMMIKIIIGLAAVLSVVMIVVGGVEYMTSELAHTKESGKDRITHAIFGLLLALGAYALLYTINPDLLKSDFGVPEATVTTPTQTTPK